MRPLLLLALGGSMIGAAVLGASVLASGGDADAPQIEAPAQAPPAGRCRQGDFPDRVRCLFNPLRR